VARLCIVPVPRLLHRSSGSRHECSDSSSIMLGVWDIGTLAYTCIIITVNLHLLMASGYITIWHQLSVGGSIVGWFLFLYFYSCVQGSWRHLQLFFAIQIRIQNENFAFLMFVRFHL
jgi:phospholipid-transporting ATPase